MLIFPDIDPVALALGPIAIRWYSLAYIVGIVMGYCIVKRLPLPRPRASKGPQSGSRICLPVATS